MLVKFNIFRRYKAWAFHPEGVLVLAGSHKPTDGIVEISYDYGMTFQNLTEIPYAHEHKELYGACLLFIDVDMVFLAGGQKGTCQNYKIDNFIDICVFQTQTPSTAIRTF